MALVLWPNHCTLCITQSHTKSEQSMLDLQYPFFSPDVFGRASGLPALFILCQAARGAWLVQWVRESESNCESDSYCESDSVRETVKVIERVTPPCVTGTARERESESNCEGDSKWVSESNWESDFSMRAFISFRGIGSFFYLSVGHFLSVSR